MIVPLFAEGIIKCKYFLAVFLNGPASFYYFTLACRACIFASLANSQDIRELLHMLE